MPHIDYQNNGEEFIRLSLEKVEKKIRNELDKEVNEMRSINKPVDGMSNSNLQEKSPRKVRMVVVGRNEQKGRNLSMP